MAVIGKKERVSGDEIQEKNGEKEIKVVRNGKQIHRELETRD